MNFLFLRRKMIQQNKLNLKKLIYYLILIYMVFLVSMPHKFNNAILHLVSVLGIYISFKERINSFQMEHLKIISWITVIYFFWLLFTTIVSASNLEDLDPMRVHLFYLFAPFIFLAIWFSNIDLKKIIYLLKIGILLTVSITLFQYIFEVAEGTYWRRPSGFVNANILGSILALMTFLSVSNYQNEDKKSKLLSKIVLITAIIGLAINGSRGAWIIALVLFLLNSLVFIKDFSKLERLKYFSIFLVIMVIFASLPNVQKRINSAVEEYREFNHINYTDAKYQDLSHPEFQRLKSITLRIFLWEAGLTASLDHPKFGVGYGQTMPYLISKTKIPVLVEHDDILHNDYLEVLMAAGFPGLILLLLCLLWPMKVFYKSLRKNELVGYLGILLCVGVGIAGLSHGALTHKYISGFYILLLGFLFTAKEKSCYKI